MLRFLYEFVIYNGVKFTTSLISTVLVHTTTFKNVENDENDWVSYLNYALEAYLILPSYERTTDFCFTHDGVFFCIKVNHTAN